MKTQNLQETKNIFDVYLLSNEEMIKVRGGDGDPGQLPPAPPVRI
jgi:hypothetical protein